MSGTYSSDLNSHEAINWFECILHSVIKSAKLALQFFILGSVALYLVYLLGLLVCSMLTGLGIIKSGFCSLLFL